MPNKPILGLRLLQSFLLPKGGEIWPLAQRQDQEYPQSGSMGTWADGGEPGPDLRAEEARKKQLWNH